MVRKGTHKLSFKRKSNNTDNKIEIGWNKNIWTKTLTAYNIVLVEDMKVTGKNTFPRLISRNLIQFQYVDIHGKEP